VSLKSFSAYYVHVEWEEANDGERDDFPQILDLLMRRLTNLEVLHLDLRR